MRLPQSLPIAPLVQNNLSCYNCPYPLIFNPTKPMPTIITTEQVKALRDQTGISIMQCKKALEEAGGDTEKALVILRKKSGELGAKKADRVFKAGTIAGYMHATGRVGAMVELLSESDFVSGSDEFKTLARDIAMHVAATNPKFLRKGDIKESDMTAAKSVFTEEVKGKPAAMQEKILEGKLAGYRSEEHT